MRARQDGRYFIVGDANPGIINYEIIRIETASKAEALKNVTRFNLAANARTKKRTAALVKVQAELEEAILLEKEIV